MTCSQQLGTPRSEDAAAGALLARARACPRQALSTRASKLWPRDPRPACHRSESPASGGREPNRGCTRHPSLRPVPPSGPEPRRHDRAGRSSSRARAGHGHGEGRAHAGILARSPDDSNRPRLSRHRKAHATGARRAARVCGTARETRFRDGSDERRVPERADTGASARHSPPRPPHGTRCSARVLAGAASEVRPLGASRQRTATRAALLLCDDLDPLVRDVQSRIAPERASRGRNVRVPSGFHRCAQVLGIARRDAPSRAHGSATAPVSPTLRRGRGSVARCGRQARRTRS